MRTKSTLINSLYSAISYVIVGVLAIVTRRVFLNTLSVEYLGYEGLFGNIVSVLSFADLNIENLILYRMLNAYAKEDYDDMNKLLSTYAFLYRIIGIGVIVVGLGLIPFLRFIISENSASWGYIYVLYCIQLLSTASMYLLAYYRIIFSVSQRDYICTKIDLFVSGFVIGTKILILIFFKNYIAYLLCGVMTGIISNIIILKKCKKEYVYTKRLRKIRIADIKELKIHTDLKDNILQKVGLIVYGATDNILISSFLGVANVGLYSNYTLLQGYITDFLNKFFKPFLMSIGNYVYTEKEEEGFKMFKMFDLFSFFMACEISIGYLIIINPLISILFGKKFVLNLGFVVCLAINQFVAWNHFFLAYYRSAFGRYDLDKKFIIAGAILNLIISIALVNVWGLAGILTGTIIGQIGFWIGRVKIVYTEYITEDVRKYYIRQFFRIVLVVVEALLVFSISISINDNIIGLFVKIGLVLVIPVCINILVFKKSEELKMMLSYIIEMKKYILKVND